MMAKASAKPAKKTVSPKKSASSRGDTKQPDAKAAAPNSRKSRNFPKHSLEEAGVVAKKLQDEMGGKPMNRLLLAEAIGLSPSSSTFRDILSSSFKYGLTDGTEKAETISLTPLGDASTSNDQQKRMTAFRTAAFKSPVFGQFFRDYTNKRVPSTEMLPRILTTTYGVPSELTGECAKLISANGKFVHIIREISGSSHIVLEEGTLADADEEVATGFENDTGSSSPPAPFLAEGTGAANSPHDKPEQTGPKPIFVAHGKNKAPLQQLQQLLTTFRISHKVVVDEANLGRPISQKVKDTLNLCGSAILIFTKDEQFMDKEGKEIWRPSENVIFELGAASFLYGDRVVVFKEKGIYFPTNFKVSATSNSTIMTCRRGRQTYSRN